MNAARLEQLRLSLLLALKHAGDMFVGETELHFGVSLNGFRGLDLSDVRSELQYLADKGLIVRNERKLISPEVRQWRITATGRDYLAGNE